MNKLKKSLIITLPPDIFGGVGTKAKILADYLQSEGHKTTIAYYRPLRRKSELNVSFWQIPWRLKPEVLMESSFGGHDCRVVGCYFPEFEPSFSRPSSLWEDLVKCHDLHFVVGGTPVLANILETLDVPYIVWCGSDLVGDRWNRQIVMPIIRRFLDRKIVMPFLLSHQLDQGCQLSVRRALPAHDASVHRAALGSRGWRHAGIDARNLRSAPVRPSDSRRRRHAAQPWRLQPGALGHRPLGGGSGPVGTRPNFFQQRPLNGR